MDDFLQSLFQQEYDKEAVCDLTAIFKDIKVMNRTTKSLSIQSIGTFKRTDETFQVIKEYLEETKNDKVFIKIGFLASDDNSMYVEMMIYKYLRKLLLDNRTPNIMRYVMSFHCNDFINTVERTEEGLYKEKTLKILKKMQKQYSKLNLDEAIITLIELGKGMQFNELMGILSDDDFLSIIFQVFYTLRELHLNNIRHNDIHLANIWINILPNPKRMIYFVDDNTYAVFDTKYIVKIFDFDKGTFTNDTLTNFVISTGFCPKYGMCENRDERFDLLIVLHGLLSSVYASKAMKDFVKKCIRDPKYLKSDNFRFPGRYCEPLPKEEEEEEEEEEKCSFDHVIEEHAVYNIQQLCDSTDVFSFVKHLLTDGFDSADLPVTEEQPLSSIPLYTFKTNVYISSECTYKPIVFANKLLKLQKATS